MEENPHLDPTSTSNYLLCCIAPLSLPSPNAISYTRPLSLSHAVESWDVIKKEFAQVFDLALPGLHHPITLTSSNTVSMTDGKMAKF